MLWRSILFNGISLRLWKKTFVRRQSYIGHVLSFSYTDPTLKAIWDLIIYSPSGRRYYPINNCASSYILRPRTAGFFFISGRLKVSHVQRDKRPSVGCRHPKKACAFAPMRIWFIQYLGRIYVCVCVLVPCAPQGAKENCTDFTDGKESKKAPIQWCVYKSFFFFSFLPF